MKDVPVPGAADALRRQAVGRCSRGSEQAMPFFTHGARITDLGHFSARLREQYFIRFLTARGSYEEPNAPWYYHRTLRLKGRGRLRVLVMDRKGRSNP